jgi:hypothetical protein
MRIQTLVGLAMLVFITAVHAESAATRPDPWQVSFPAAGTKVTRVEMDAKGQEIPASKVDDEIVIDQGKINTAGFARMGFSAVRVHSFATNGANLYRGETTTADGGTVMWSWRGLMPGERSNPFVANVGWERDGAQRRWIVREKS